MAANIPASLKQADLTRFIVRASQLEHVKPVVAYWCEYWIVKQILDKNLQNVDSETFSFTMALMDKLEQIKADNATNDAIVDDVAGQTYVEHFGLETFFRADRTVKANKVSKQTADTFQAAATFLELMNIWTTPDADTVSKIKYAKWNAVRIMKAIKEGKDPNESNPKEPEPEQLPALDPNDPEVRALTRQPTVEDVPDEQDGIETRLARQSLIDQSLHPSAQVSARVSPEPTKAFEPYPKDGFPYTAVQDDNVSPLEPSPSPSNPRKGSLGGGYFPAVPTSTGGTTGEDGDDMLDLGLPQQPSAPPGSRGDFESFPPPSIPDELPQDFYQQSPQQPLFQQPPFQPQPQQHIPQPHTRTVNTAPRPPQPPQTYFTPSAPPPGPLPFQPPPGQQFSPQYQAPPVQTPQFAQRSHQPHGRDAVQETEAQRQQVAIDDMAIAKAQKHAKWAISALNFEDADTAIRELRAALKTLGAP